MECQSLRLPDDHLGLYVHVPFCVRKCRYCDFASQPFEAELPDRYLEALAREAECRRRECPRPLQSIYIGGGTPTVLTGAQLRHLWEDVIAPFPRLPNAEITIEANPGTLTDEVLAALAALPLTRVSLGVQSFHVDELAMLGRIHSPQDAVDGVRALRAIGIPQINLDLMYGLPGQTRARWQETLDQALALQPEHLSCYALILEEGVPLTAEVRAGLLTLPGEDEEDAMLMAAEEAFVAAGLARYEVSNAARPGAHSRHNLGYWLGRDYLGLGVAATSTLGVLRWRNAGDAASYVTRQFQGLPVVEYIERLSMKERLLEQVMLGLRLRHGFSLAAAEARCGCALRHIAGSALEALIDQGLLEHTGSDLRLTAQGYPIANTVVARLMAAVK